MKKIEEAIERLRYKAENIKAHIEPEFFNEVADALETLKELQKRNMTPDIIQEYMKFEDELVRNNFTFNSVLEAREKQVPKKVIIKKIVENDIPDKMILCPICKDGIIEGMKYCWECGNKLDWSEADE